MNTVALVALSAVATRSAADATIVGVGQDVAALAGAGAVGCLAELVALRPFEWLATVADKPPRAWLVAATAVLAVVGGVHTLSIARRLILFGTDAVQGRWFLGGSGCCC